MFEWIITESEMTMSRGCTGMGGVADGEKREDGMGRTYLWGGDKDVIRGVDGISY